MIQKNKISEPVSLSTPVLETIDLYPTFEKYFNVEATTALSTKSSSMLYQYNEAVGSKRDVAKDKVFEILQKLKIKSTNSYIPIAGYVRKVAPVQCFGLTVSELDLVPATLRLIDVINSLAKFNYIKASLAKPFAVKLHNPDNPSINKYAVVSYLAISVDNELAVKNIYGKYMFQEGGIPTEFKDVDLREK